MCLYKHFIELWSFVLDLISAPSCKVQIWLFFRWLVCYLFIDFPLLPNVAPFYNEVQTKNDSFERFMHTLFVLNVTFMYWIAKKIPSHGRSNYSFVCKYAKEGFAEATVEKEELGEKHFNHIYWPFPFHIPRVVKKWPFVEGLLPQSSTRLVFLWIILKGVSI